MRDFNQQTICEMKEEIEELKADIENGIINVYVWNEYTESKIFSGK